MRTRPLKFKHGLQNKTCCVLVAQKAAGQAYADRQFGETLDLMDELVKEEPEAARFHEMRAQVL